MVNKSNSRVEESIGGDDASPLSSRHRLKNETLWILPLFVLMIILLTSSVNAQQQTIPPVKINTCVDLPQICANCTFVNVTSIVSNQTKALSSQIRMTKTGTFYNLTFCNNSAVGQYIVNWLADPDGLLTVGNFDYQVTPTGRILDTSESIIYIILTIAIFIIFLMALYPALFIPYSNDVDMNGSPIRVTRKKYIKLGFILLSYVLFVWFLNTLIALSTNYLGTTVFLGFVSFLFDTLNRISLYFSIFIIVLCIFEVIRDANLERTLQELGNGFRYG